MNVMLEKEWMNENEWNGYARELINKKMNGIIRWIGWIDKRMNYWMDEWIKLKESIVYNILQQ